MWGDAVLMGLIVVFVLGGAAVMVGTWVGRAERKGDDYCVGCDADLTDGAYAYHSGHPLCRDCADEIGVPAAWYGNDLEG